jgi:hypothetical protein
LTGNLGEHWSPWSNDTGMVAKLTLSASHVRFICLAHVMATSCTLPTDDLVSADAGASPEPVDAGTEMTLSEFCDAQFPVLVELYAKCLGGSPAEWERREREGRRNESCRRLKQSIEQGRAVFVATEASLCLQELQKLSCEQYYRNDFPPACQQARQGRLEEGAECEYYFDQCSEGLICDDEPVFSVYDWYTVEGTCTKRCVLTSGPRVEGMSCTGVGFECGEGLVCDTFSDTPRCRSVPSLGDSCDASCAPGAFCDRDQRVCLASRGSGDPCLSNDFSECAGFLTCIDDSADSGRCHPRVKIGETCSGRRCVGFCDEHDICRIDLARGEPCEGTALVGDPRCGPGNYCSSPTGLGTCVAQKLEDEPCESTRECWFGECEMGRCAFLANFRCE